MKITSVNNELIKETAKLLKNKYREETSLYEQDFSWSGFEWMNVDVNNNVIAFIRKNTKGDFCYGN